MIYFPTTISQPSYPLEETFEDNSLRSTFEDGSMQSRRKFTRTRMKYKVSWTKMSNTEYQTLKTFIRETVNYSATSFMWQYPKINSTDTEKYIEVRITNVEDAQLTEANYWSVSLELTEV